MKTYKIAGVSGTLWGFIKLYAAASLIIFVALTLGGFCIKYYLQIKG